MSQFVLGAKGNPKSVLKTNKLGKVELVLGDELEGEFVDGDRFVASSSGKGLDEMVEIVGGPSGSELDRLTEILGDDSTGFYGRGSGGGGGGRGYGGSRHHHRDGGYGSSSSSSAPGYNSYSFESPAGTIPGFTGPGQLPIQAQQAAAYQASLYPYGQYPYGTSTQYPPGVPQPTIDVTVGSFVGAALRKGAKPAKIAAYLQGLGASKKQIRKAFITSGEFVQGDKFVASSSGDRFVASSSGDRFVASSSGKVGAFVGAALRKGANPIKLASYLQGIGCSNGSIKKAFVQNRNIKTA